VKIMEQKVIVITRREARSLPVALPEAFSELTPFVEIWALSTETERNKRRHTVGMEAIVEFKEAMLPRVDELVAWLNQFALASLPEDAQTLMYLLLSFAEIAPAVEFYRQPAVIDGYDPRRFVADETFTMRPAV
jgi:hypothetical protein